MRIVFMGTPRIAATVLENLVQQHEVVAVYTRPDAVSGRGKKLVPSPVKQVAAKFDLPVHTPTSFRDESELSTLAAYKPDVIVVVAYGMILPQTVIDIPRYECLNIHASSLPRWRGAAPIQRAMLAQDPQVGVCVMKVVKALDAGDYAVCRTTEIGDKTYLALIDEIADLGSSALLTVLAQIETGTVCWTPQDENLVTYAKKIDKGEMFVAPDMSSQQVFLNIQASSPAHPARCVIGDRALTLMDSRRVTDPEIKELLRPLQYGCVIFLRKRLFIECADGSVEILALKPDGKKAMDAKAFCAGLQNAKSGKVTWRALS